MGGDPTELDQSAFRVAGVSVRAETLYGMLGVLPVIALYLLIAVGPILFVVYSSLFRIPLANPEWEFVGLSNYTAMFQLEHFWGSLGRNVVFMTASTLFQMVIGVWLALVLHNVSVGKKVLTAVVINAFLIPTVIITFLSRFMLNQYTGVLHIVGSEWLGLWGPGQYALGSTTLSMPIVILTGSWKFSVFITILTLAQLRAIPPQYYETAKVCGASTYEMFRDITFPRIRGVLLIAVLLRAVFMFNKFDLIWLMTKGGPGFATTTLPVLAYQTTFTGGQYGLGSTLAVVMFLVLAGGGIAFLYLFEPSEEVET